jgi:hypothetical protein
VANEKNLTSKTYGGGPAGSQGITERQGDENRIERSGYPTAPRNATDEALPFVNAATGAGAKTGDGRISPDLVEDKGLPTEVRGAAKPLAGVGPMGTKKVPA